MGSDAQAFLNDLIASVAFLRCEASGNLDHLMTSPCSLISKYLDKRSPGSVGNALCQMVILEHAGDVQIFNTNAGIALCIGFGGLEEEISALALDFEMGLGAIACCLAPSVAPLLAAAEVALLSSEGPLALTVVAWIGNGLALGIS